MKDRQTIIYIMSNERSGSTLIENILTKSSQIVSVGETYLLGGYIHKVGPGFSWDWNCSCGKSLMECEFWNKIYGLLNISDPLEIENTKIIYPKRKNKDEQKSKNDEVASLMNRIYGAVFETTNCDIVVDSSKKAFHGASLYQDSPYNFKFIYLKRDLRAVTFSKQKWRKKYGAKDISLLKLLIANYVHRLWCWFVLRKIDKKDVFYLKYEDFFERPQQTLDDMSKFFGFHPYKMPEFMELMDDHTIAGTPNRFEKRKIQYDAKWLSNAKKRPFINALGLILNKIG